MNISIADERMWPAQGIAIVRGTSAPIMIDLTLGDSEPYELTSEEIMRFGVKESRTSASYAVVKEVTSDDYYEGMYVIWLDPSETMLDPGKYFYDIGIQSGDDYVVVIPNSRFEVIPNITVKEG